MSHFPICIFGAGVIGLSTAYQLLLQRPGLSGKIVIVDWKLPGQSSWAGAGLLPPPPTKDSSDPLEQLQRLSLSQFEKWSADLRLQTGIDNGFRKCGGYYLAFSAGEFASLVGLEDFWEEVGIGFRRIDLSQFQEKEPWVADQLSSKPPKLIAEIPGETQVRNPWHLNALRTACELLGTKFITIEEKENLVADLDSNKPSMKVDGQKFTFDQSVIACGSWTSEFLKQQFGENLGVEVFPMKGQIVLLKSGGSSQSPPFQGVLNVGTRYLVPRPDGRILIGSTEEEVGFDHSPTQEVRQELLNFAAGFLPKTREMEIEKQWAGFRPASYHQTPIIGTLPNNPNIWVATGHFRSGIQFSIGTAQCVAAGILGEKPPIDLSIFSPR